MMYNQSVSNAQSPEIIESNGQTFLIADCTCGYKVYVWDGAWLYTGTVTGDDLIFDTPEAP